MSTSQANGTMSSADFSSLDLSAPTQKVRFLEVTAPHLQKQSFCDFSCALSFEIPTLALNIMRVFGICLASSAVILGSLLCMIVG